MITRTETVKLSYGDTVKLKNNEDYKAEHVVFFYILMSMKNIFFCEVVCLLAYKHNILLAIFLMICYKMY